jgi:protein-disulfide isomerase
MPHRTWLVPLALAVASLTPAPAPAAEAAGIADEQRPAIEAIIHDYLLQHPDVLIEALRNAEAKLKSEAKDKSRDEVKLHWDELVNDPATPVGGNPKGDVSLVEFFDYRCPYCKEVQPLVQKLTGEDPAIRLVYKDVPLLGPASFTAARAALAAQRQGKHEAFHLVMMNTKGQIGDDAVFAVAKAVGLDLDRLKKDMAAPEIDQQLKANLALANALDVHGTPTFIAGDQVVEGALELSGLKEMIATARKQ